MTEYPEHIIAAFLTSWRPKEIMAAAKISKNKYYKLRGDPDFQRILTERRSEIVKDAILKMERLLDRDIDIVQQIIEDPETAKQVRLNGVRLIMDQLNSWKQTVELTDRIQQLEKDAESKKSDDLGGYYQ